MKIVDQQAFTSYLQPNESIQWVGGPPSGLLFRKSDVFMIPFSLLWGGFAFFWEITAYNSGASMFFLLFGSVFVIMGLYIAIGRFGYDILKRESTIHGLTTERALILSGIFSRSLKSINLKATPEISLEQKSNGYGTVTFGNSSSSRSLFSNSYGAGYGQPVIPCFELIENVSSGHQMIQGIQRK